MHDVNMEKVRSFMIEKSDVRIDSDSHNNTNNNNYNNNNNRNNNLDHDKHCETVST